jgi:ABC-type transport system substrate-binding protein
MTRAARMRLTIGLALGVALLALAGCGRAVGSGATDSTLDWAGQALESIGFSSADVTDPATPTAAPSPDGKKAPNKPRIIARHKLIRFAFGKKALHGEAVVQTDDGTKTVVVQRGTVTAADATSITVKSSDGFTLTWTIGDPIKVVKDKTQASPSALTVGTTVGVAGERTGSTTTARLVVVPATQ